MDICKRYMNSLEAETACEEKVEELSETVSMALKIAGEEEIMGLCSRNDPGKQL